MKATGEIEITEELTLNNPTLTVKAVSYEWLTNKVNVEILFKESNATIDHSRLFTFDNTGGANLTDDDIYSFIKNDETLGIFS
jgi:hypothetical protein